MHGQKTRKFFAKLVRLGYASMHDCRHNRARIYHVNQRALYAAIGEADSGLRRRLTINRAIQRLMVLDAIVEDPDLIWLATADEKVAHLMALTGIAPTELPHRTIGDGDARQVRLFPERLPIGIHLAGRGVIVYVIDRPDLDDFRVFLERHAALLRALPIWTLRIVVPPHLPGMAAQARQAVQFQLMEPFRDVVVNEMRWYFEQLRSSSSTEAARLERARRAFKSGRAQAIYRCWTLDGEAALVSVGSALQEAIPLVVGPFDLILAASIEAHQRLARRRANAGRLRQLGQARPMRVAGAPHDGGSGVARDRATATVRPCLSRARPSGPAPTQRSRDASPCRSVDGYRRVVLPGVLEARCRKRQIASESARTTAMPRSVSSASK